jgi:hypothetical protein
MVKETQKTTFEQNMQAMSKMSPKEMEAKVAEFTRMCICGGCPTYAGTGEKRLVFCATGKSKIIKKEKGCLCPGCPVQNKLSLRWDYYCLKGSGKEQAGT